MERTSQPISLNEPPKPSQVCAVAVSSTVTSASPSVTSVSDPPVFQYASGADVTSETAPPAVPHGLVSGRQDPLQSMRPAGHRHTPASQVWAAPQGMPQAPQFVASVATSTHRWPQGVSAAAQIGAVQLTPPGSLVQ